MVCGQEVGMGSSSEALVARFSTGMHKCVVFHSSGDFIANDLWELKNI